MALPDIATTDGWQRIEAELPEDIEELAKKNKVLETKYGNAKITSASDLLRLILLHAGVGLPLRQAVTVMAEADGPDVSHVTLHKKMRLSSPFLHDLVAWLSRGGTDETAPERWAGYDVTVVDASTFCGPGADTTDARVHFQMRLCDLEILQATMEDRTVGESFKRFEWKPGQLAVGDRGYCNPPGLRHVVEQGADVLVRVNRASFPLFDAQANKIELLPLLRKMRGHRPLDRWACVYDKEHDDYIEGRLIAFRLPAAEAEKARARVRRELGRKASRADLEAAQYVVLFTTVPKEKMPTAMCLSLYRLRWQIELAFKRWKSLCHFDRLPNYRDDTILTWLYAKLLLGLVMHRMAAGVSSLFPPEDSAETSMVLDALEDGQHLLADSRRGSVAA